MVLVGVVLVRNAPTLSTSPSDTQFLGFRATARFSPCFCFQPGGRRGVGLLNGRSHMKVKMLGRQHTFPKLCVVPNGPCCIPNSRACGGAMRTWQAFSFYQQCARALRRIQSSRIVVFVHKLERNHYCFDILLIYYSLHT